jgi:hypothetical protein
MVPQLPPSAAALEVLAAALAELAGLVELGAVAVVVDELDEQAVAEASSSAPPSPSVSRADTRLMQISSSGGCNYLPVILGAGISPRKISNPNTSH